MHPKLNPKMKNAITRDATRTISKWLNEEPNTPIDREALVTVLARVGFLELELQALKNAFEAMLGRTAGIVELMQTAQYELRHANIIGNHALNNMPTHYSSEPYEKLGADKTGDDAAEKVPEGWHLVPNVATDKMYFAFSDKYGTDFDQAYEAMLQAAPAVPEETK